MASKNAGEARVSIVPDSSGFLKKLEADLKAKRYEYKLPVDADTSPAERETERFRQEQKRKPFGVDVKADTEQARAEIAAFREREQRKALRLKIEFDESNLAEKLKRKLDEIDFSGLGSGLKLNLGAAAIGELPALATAITSVAGAIQQLSGAGLVIPGVFAGIAADVGVVKLGVMGLGDAFKALDKASDGKAKNIDAANAALAKLAPNAAEAVKTVYGLKPAFEDLQKLDSNNLLAGASGAIKTLVDSDLPVLRRGVDGISKALNQNLLQAAGSLGSPSSQGLLDRILGNTGDAQSRLTKAIDPIIHAVETLSAAGSDTLPRLAAGVGKLADRFDNFITSADDSGKLKKWIDDGITGFDHLGNTVLNIGKTFTALTQAAGGGGGLLQILDSATGKLSTFLNSAQGQETLKKFFADGREELAQLMPIVENLGPILGGLFNAAHDATALWLPLIKEATDVLAKDPDLVRLIADAFLAWKFVPIITGVTDALAAIGPSAKGVAADVEAAATKSSGALGGLSDKMKLLKQAGIIGGGALVLGGVTDQVKNGGPDPLGAAETIGGGALIGLSVGGPFGAAAGALIGAAGEMVATIKQGMDEQTAKFNEQWDRRHNETDPKAIERDNALTQQQLAPLLNQPSASKDLAAKIASGQLPGYTLGPGGSVIGPNGQPVSGLNVTPPPPPAPPPPPKPVPVSTVQGIPVPFNVPPPAVTAAKPATPQQQQQVAANPVTAGTTIAATVDPKAQASVDNLAKSITSLPEGKVVIQDASPAVIDNLKQLDTKITTLPEGKVEVTANTEEAKTKLDALIRDYQNQIINIKLNPQTIGVPVAPGHASGGILPGYSPGKDNMLVPLAGGEGIVRPEAVRKYGPGVIHMLNQGFAPGGIVPDYISIATGGSGGAAPGPIAPNPAQGGIGSIAQSFLSGLGGPIGNLGGLFGGANGSSDSGTTLTPGLAGLFQAGSNPDLLGQWGQQTGDWLGGFAAKTLTSFGTALWQGVLGFFGLGNSILSPTNPYIQDALKGAGFLLGDSGPFAGKGGSSKKGATEKQLREGGQKIDRADQKVALIQQRIAELKPDAKQSQRDSLANQLANAQQDAADARSDFAALQSGSGSSSTGQVPLGTTPPGTGASRWTPVIQQALADVGPKYGITNIPAWTKALEGQIQFESGGDPTIDNPRDSDGQPALGLGQFKQGTFNAHNITGGDVHDGTAAIYAMIDYVASRYGQNSAGVPNGINQGHGYATGGGVDTVPAMLTPGEHVLTTDDVAAMGGQAGVYRFRQALHGYDIGGQVYGGNFNPGVRIDTSTSSVAPPFDPNSLQFGDLLKITGALGPDDIGEQAIHKDHWVPGRDPWLSYGQGINNRPAVPDGKGFSDPNVNPWIAHMAIGGEVYPFPDALTPLPPRPSPDAQKVNRPNPTPAPVVPRPPVVQRPPVVVAPPPVEPPPPAQPEQRPYQPGPAPVGASDGSVKSHTLPAISKGITSGFATAGSLAQTAAAIGSFGAAGAAGGIGAGIGGGGGGPSISGLFQQFGKIANDIVDVGSAFLVGNVTGGTTANAYGETLRPAQNVPLTAPLNQQRTYNIQAGYKPYDLVDALNLMDSQHNQAALAGYRG